MCLREEAASNDHEGIRGRALSTASNHNYTFTKTSVIISRVKRTRFKGICFFISCGLQRRWTQNRNKRFNIVMSVIRFLAYSPIECVWREIRESRETIVSLNLVINRANCPPIPSFCVSVTLVKCFHNSLIIWFHTHTHAHSFRYLSFCLSHSLFVSPLTLVFAFQ